MRISVEHEIVLQTGSVLRGDEVTNFYVERQRTRKTNDQIRSILNRIQPRPEMLQRFIAKPIAEKQMYMDQTIPLIDDIYQAPDIVLDLFWEHENDPGFNAEYWAYAWFNLGDREDSLTIRAKVTSYESVISIADEIAGQSLQTKIIQRIAEKYIHERDI